MEVEEAHAGAHKYKGTEWGKGGGGHTGLGCYKAATALSCNMWGPVSQHAHAHTHKEKRLHPLGRVLREELSARLGPKTLPQLQVDINNACTCVSQGQHHQL